MLNAKEKQELAALQRKWATRRAKQREIERCQTLEHKRDCPAWPLCSCIVRGKVSDCPRRFHY